MACVLHLKIYVKIDQCKPSQKLCNHLHHISAEAFCTSIYMNIYIYYYMLFIIYYLYFYDLHEFVLRLLDVMSDICVNLGTSGRAFEPSACQKLSKI